MSSDFIILPAIDLLGGKCVRLLQGDYDKETVYSDSPAEQALSFQEQGAEFIHLVALDGAKEGKPINLEAVTAICNAVSIPCEIGGGVRTLEDAEQFFDAGVQRVILGSACQFTCLHKLRRELRPVRRHFCGPHCRHRCSTLYAIYIPLVWSQNLHDF